MQKHAAVEHYLKHGYCLAFTCRTLGYPSDVLLSRGRHGEAKSVAVLGAAI